MCKISVCGEQGAYPWDLLKARHLMAWVYVWMLRNIAYGICLRAVGCGQFARILTRPVVTHA